MAKLYSVYGDKIHRPSIGEQILVDEAWGSMKAFTRIDIFRDRKKVCNIQYAIYNNYKYHREYITLDQGESRYNMVT